MRSRPRAVPEPALRAVHVFVLFAFAVAQPLFDLLKRNAEFLVAHRSSHVDVVVLGLLLCVVAPAIIIAIEGVVAAIRPRLGRALHWMVVAGLTSLIVLPPIKDLAAPIVVVGASVLAGCMGATAYAYFVPVRAVLSVLAPSPAIFLALFLLNANIAAIDRTTDHVAGQPVAHGPRPPIVIVVFDELDVTSLMDERHEIDAVRYPSFAALAQDSTWFRNATGVTNQTSEAIPTMLTGTYPRVARLPVASNYPQNLFTMLAGDYALNVVESITQLCDSESCRERQQRQPWRARWASLVTDLDIVYVHATLPSAWTQHFPSISENWTGFVGGGHNSPTLGAVDRAGRFLDFVTSLTPSPEPTLNYLHVLLPHVPYEYLPSGRRYAVEGGLAGLVNEQWGSDETPILHAQERYLLQLGYVDRLLGRLVARLKTQGMYDEALLVVTADHGVSFLPNEPRRVITAATGPSMLPVPLFIKTPGQRASTISDRNVESIDILPTIAEVLGMPVPWRIDGTSALDGTRPERPVKSVWQNGDLEEWEGQFNRKYQSLERRVALFGTGTLRTVLVSSPYRELIGHIVTSDDRSPAQATRLEIYNERLFADVNLNGSFVPALVTGRILHTSSPAAPSDLGVALNGRIVATTRTFGEGAERFAVVVPDDAFRTGRNELEVFALSRHDSRTMFARIQPLSTPTFTLVASGDTTILTSPARPSIAVSKNVVNGNLDYACIDDGRVAFTGWAADVKERKAADSVLVFADGKLLHATLPDTPRPDVSLAHGLPEAVQPGFTLQLPIASGKLSVRIFALSGDTAWELTYVSNCHPRSATEKSDDRTED